jgi:N-carbamoylputrescine amidase
VKYKLIVFLVICIAISIIACEYEEGYIQSPFSQWWQAPMVYDDSGATKSLNVAAVSFYVDLSPEVNRNKMAALIDKIKNEQPDVRLILFPETTLGYYDKPKNSPDYHKSIAETIPGETVNVLSPKAIEHQIYISFGIIEKSGVDFYNSQVLIGPDGTILSVHHKNYLTQVEKEFGCKAGNDITVNIVDNIKVATIICKDSMVFETHKRIHKSGAELVLLPVANLTAHVDHNLRPNHFTYTWLLGANRIGNEDGIDYEGSIYLMSPSGELKIRSFGKEGYIYGVVKCR